MESRRIIYMPAWAKALAIALLAFLFVMSGYLTWRYTFLEYNHDIVSSSISLIQLAATGLLLFITVALSERDVNPHRLLQRTENWFRETLKDALARTQTPLPDTPHGARGEETPLIVSVRVGKERLKAYVTIKPKGVPKLALSMTIFLNVRKLSLFVDVPIKPGQAIEELERVFDVTLKGCNFIGYKWFMQKEDKPLDDVPRVVISLYGDVSDDFLLKPLEQLYWAQDISLFVRSLLLQAHIHRVSLAEGARNLG